MYLLSFEKLVDVIVVVAPVTWLWKVMVGNNGRLRR